MFQVDIFHDQSHKGLDGLSTRWSSQAISSSSVGFNSVYQLALCDRRRPVDENPRSERMVWGCIRQSSSTTTGDPYLSHGHVTLGGGLEMKDFCLGLNSSAIITLLHEKVNPRNWQILSLGDARFLQLFRIVASGCGKPRNNIDYGRSLLTTQLVKWERLRFFATFSKQKIHEKHPKHSCTIHTNTS